MGAFWAGTDGTLWRSSTALNSEFVQMYTDGTAVTRMAVDDRETLYGINSAGKPVLYGNDGWASLDLGDHSEPYVMVDVAVAIDDDTAWFVAREGQFYVDSPNVTTEKEVMLPVMSISPMKAADPSDVNAVGEAWGVLGWGGLAISSGDAWVFKTGNTDMMSDVAEVSTSVNASALPSRP